MKKLLILSMVFAMAAVAPCAGETWYFLVAEPLTDPCDPCVTSDSYVLPLTDPCDIDYARDLVEYGPGIGSSIVVAAIDHWDLFMSNCRKSFMVVRSQVLMCF